MTSKEWSRVLSFKSTLPPASANVEMFYKFLVFHFHAGRLCFLSLQIFAPRIRALHKPRFAPLYFPLCRPTLCSVLHTTGIRWQRPLRFAQLTILLAQLFCTSLVSFIGSFLQPISVFFCSQSQVFLQPISGFLQPISGWQQHGRATLLPAQIPDVPFNPDQIRVANPFCCFFLICFWNVITGGMQGMSGATQETKLWSFG